MEKKKYKAFDIILVIVLGVVCVSCVLPFINLLAVSFSGSTAVAAGKVGFVPVDFTLASYKYILEDGSFFGHCLFLSKGQ